MHYRTAKVSLNGRVAGKLEELPGGATRFTYGNPWLRGSGAVPISLTLPLREKPYESEGLHPFFENLLPEGWLLEVSARKLKLPKTDAFGLLLAMGSDCVGAVEIVPE
jgi:serine/threonine-protein kinase HipA